ncbi:MAG TPA: hypothetical protein VFU94_09800 [Conexibacter sp.]|nr:hypothetical protein [Conexibacter sp.]
MTALIDEFCRLPPASNPEIVITASSLKVETPQEEVALVERLWSPTHRIVRRLAQHRYRAVIIGWGPVGYASTLMQDRETWWVFGSRVTLCARGEAILADLLCAGLPVDPDGVRVAYRMPGGWEPHDTMEHVFPHVLMGAVVDDRRLVALPVTEGHWAQRIWLGVEPQRSRL